MQGGPAAAAQPAYEPPAESALLADGLIEPVRASPMGVSLHEEQAMCVRLLQKQGVAGCSRVLPCGSAVLHSKNHDRLHAPSIHGPFS